MKLGFFHANKYQTFLQVGTVNFSGMATYGRSIQNNRFAKSLQYIQKEVSDEPDFLHIDEHQKFSAN